MWSFYDDKSHQIWFWWAIGHDVGILIAYWFGGREDADYLELGKLLKPLDIKMNYTNGNRTHSRHIEPERLAVSKKILNKSNVNIYRLELGIQDWYLRVSDFLNLNQCIKFLLALLLILNFLIVYII
jgi:IS1 family transposase